MTGQPKKKNKVVPRLWCYTWLEISWQAVQCEPVRFPDKAFVSCYSTIWEVFLRIFSHFSSAEQGDQSWLIVWSLGK